MDSSFIAFMFAGISGICLSIIGISFRMGQSRGVIPLHISMCMGIAGAIFFGVQMDCSAFAKLPTFVILMALLTSVGQIVAMHLAKICLSKGPLSPLWCAMNLTFLLVVIYSAILFSEHILSFQYLALISGIVCVIFASNIGGSKKENEKSTEAVSKSMKDKVVYGIMLVLILVTNSLVFIVIKDLGTRTITPGSAATYLAIYREPIFFIMYSSMAIFSGIVVLLQRAKPHRLVNLIGLGGLAAGGSIAGMLLLSLCVALPAALIFTINGIVIILGGVIGSVLFFGERRTRYWYGTVGFGVLAVILANLDKLIG